MKLLICAEEVLQRTKVRDILRELLEERFLGVYCSDIFVAETGIGGEMTIYILSERGCRVPELPQLLRAIGNALVEELQLEESQVILPGIFR